LSFPVFWNEKIGRFSYTLRKVFQPAKIKLEEPCFVRDQFLLPFFIKEFAPLFIYCSNSEGKKLGEKKFWGIFCRWCFALRFGDRILTQENLILSLQLYSGHNNL